MGRETRQQRRARARRHGPQASKSVNWPLIAGVVVILAFAAFVGSQALGFGGRISQTQAADKPIDGISCGQETVSYHVHAHLTILVKGKPVGMPRGIGAGSTNCLYWLHTHDDTGVIHIEAPSGHFHPTLGKVFDIAQSTNGESILPRVNPGNHMKVYVNRKPYYGHLRDIALLAHTTITIEIDPPFKPPQKYNFGKN